MNVMSINPTSCSRVSDKSVYENGELIDSNIQMGNYTTYPSAFLVVDPDGIYSKHYYAGTQRIAARMGQHNADELFEDKKKTAKLHGTDSTDNTFNPEELKTLQQKDLQSYLDKVGKVARLSFKKYKSGESEVQEQQQTPPPSEGAGGGSYVAYGAMAEELIYYYHPDHLGTATYLTDINGEAYEFFLNLPFGETMAEQHSQTADYVNRWKFTGHELDRETGLYYAGARYYDPRTSIFISVDPLAEKFPSHSPYNYTFNNPINFIDPDGREGRAVLEDCCGDNGDRPFGQPNYEQDTFRGNNNKRKLQGVSDGYGDTVNRNYSITVENSSKTSEEMFNKIASDFAYFVEGVSFFKNLTREEGNMQVGDEFFIKGGPTYGYREADGRDYFYSGNNRNRFDDKGNVHSGIVSTGVTVIDINKSGGNYSFTLQTWEGHVEAGTITFNISSGKNNSVSLNITSSAKNSNRATNFAYYNLGGKEGQTKHWNTFMSNFARYSGGRTTKKTIK